MRRFPESVFGVGEEPDARFSLANERTFLAWIRTGMALIAGGVALESLGLGIQPGYRLVASMLLLIAGLLVPLQAWRGWRGTERALRCEQPLPNSLLSLPLSLIVATVGVLVLLGVLSK